MATNLGLMIHADRRQMLGEMAGMARNAPIAPPQHSEEPASAASFSRRDGRRRPRRRCAEPPGFRKMADVDSGKRATTWSARC